MKLYWRGERASALACKLPLAAALALGFGATGCGADDASDPDDQADDNPAAAADDASPSEDDAPADDQPDNDAPADADNPVNDDNGGSPAAPGNGSVPDDAITDDGQGGPTPDLGPTLDGVPDKIDLLFVIDNSISMAKKHDVLARSLPAFLNRLINPICVDASGVVAASPSSVAEECPSGTARQFQPISNLHIGLVTSSLGGYGAARTCVEYSQSAESVQNVDMAHLLGSLPRGAQGVPAAAASGFLTWTATTERAPFAQDFADLVVAAGEFGCGWEAVLESWYRFLVEPYPYTQVVRKPRNASDTNTSCAGPETDGSGNQLVDQVILTQRAEFLREDSLVGIVMLSDENDCSFKASGQSWQLSQVANPDGAFSPAFKAAAACSDPALGPNHECCVSCGAATPSNCAAGVDVNGLSVSLGCEESRRYGADGVGDRANLRCFDQKRRFGVDTLYPVERYSNALRLPRICPFADDLDPSDAVPQLGRVFQSPRKRRSCVELRVH
jgi:hypothetical protein